MTALAVGALILAALSLAAVVLIEQRARVERRELIDRIQAPEAASARAWATTPTAQPEPTDRDIDLEFAQLDESLVAVPDDLEPLYFPEE